SRSLSPVEIRGSSLTGLIILPRPRGRLRYASVRTAPIPGDSPPATGSAEQAVELAADHAVALPPRRLPPAAVEDPGPAALVADPAPPLGAARPLRPRRAAHAQHLRQELLGQRQLVGPHPVVGHQQPAAHALLDGVEVAASRGLADLGEQRQGVLLDAG